MRRTALVIALLAALTGATLAGAQATGFDLSWWTADGGGVSTGSGYSLSGTIGQPDAGTLQGGGYSLAGGFWGPLATGAQHSVYLPFVKK